MRKKGEIHMKKNAVLLIVLILLFTLIPVGLSGCAIADLGQALLNTPYSQARKKIFETEYFRCIHYEWVETVTILELTEKGKEQEILVIPEEINGMKVDHIGGKLRDEKGYIQRMSDLRLQSEKVKKVYAKNTELVDHTSNFKSEQEIDFVIIAEREEDIKNMIGAFYPNIRHYPHLKYYGSILQDEEIWNDRKIEKCNTFFHKNTQIEQEIYWLDMIKDGAIYQKPEDPKREGYTFDGWFHEENCVNEWNGEYVLPEGQEELHLYAKWTKVE